MTIRRAFAVLLFIVLLTGFVPLCTHGSDAFKPAKLGSSRLEVVEGIPVLTLAGTPEEMGAAHGKLLSAETSYLMRFFLQPAAQISGGLEKLKSEALKMDSHIPERFKKEMKALALATEKDYSTVLAGIAFPDVYRGGGCSTIAACKPATKEGGHLLARNLDFFPMGVLNKYGLVVVHRPEGYHAFSSVTWPGLCGVLSAMNDAGLCCAVMEVRDGNRCFDALPSVLLFRRIMEEAVTVEEGLRILEKEKKAASNNLILLDASGSAVVAEIGPGRFDVRRAENGIVYSTNHHRAGKANPPGCRRYSYLTRFCKKHRGELDVALLKKALHMVNQGVISVQSMVFEPETLTLHLSMGELPSTGGEYKILLLKHALEAKQADAKAEEVGKDSANPVK